YIISVVVVVVKIYNILQPSLFNFDTVIIHIPNISSSFRINC
ncbi:MAG: hypothetical protein ACI8RD_007411, partial [Bacillariaceae sp.]